MISPTALTAYQALKQQHRAQMERSMQALHHQIAQQIAQLHEQEQHAIAAQAAAFAALRPQIEADARCLLSIAEFADFVTQRLADRSLLSWEADRLSQVAADPATWLLATQLLPLQILGYETLRDDSAYNDETTYTDYRYQLTAQLGTWQQTIEVSIANVHPGNPATSHSSSLSDQHNDLAYHLLKSHRYRVEPPRPEFVELNLDGEQTTQLQQEMSCLLAFVGDLFNSNECVDRFCYPQQHWEDD